MINPQEFIDSLQLRAKAEEQLTTAKLNSLINSPTTELSDDTIETAEYLVEQLVLIKQRIEALKLFKRPPAPPVKEEDTTN